MLDLWNSTSNMGHMARQAFYSMHAHYISDYLSDPASEEAADAVHADHFDREDQKNNHDPHRPKHNDFPTEHPDEVPSTDPKPSTEVPVPDQPNELPQQQPEEAPQPKDK